MTCFVIGEGTLLIGCTTILCQQGFQVKGVISQDQQVRSYCDKEGFRYVDSSSDLKSVLEENPFDFLFSITNGYILPEAILRLPRQHTINYHDGPLPAYAGVHATFWALINGETTHGITWHLVDAGIDTGAIIKQRVFPIEVSETSISLNAKSYTAAIDSFREVVDDLLTDNLKTHPQNLTGRSYYARNKRPDLFINWAQSAADIDRLQRALDFGFHPNPFGCLKLWLNNTFFQVRKAVATTTKSQTPAGTVVSILPNNLLVSTKDNLLAIGEFQSLSGEAISIESLCEQTGLREGQLLAQPDSEIIEDCRDAGKECARHQQYWINKLVGFQPTGFPWPASHEINKDRKPGCTYIDISVPDFVKALLEEQNSPGTRADYLLVAALVMLARLTDRLAVHVGFQSTTTRRIATDTHGLFAEYVPFAVEFDWEAGLEEAVAVVRQEQVEVEKRLTFAQDLLISQPALHSVAHELSERGIPIIICCDQSADECIVPEKSIAIILTDEAKYQVAFNPSIWPAHWVSEFVNRWMLLLENMVFQPKQPLKTIPLLTQTERQRILVDWNNTAVAYPATSPFISS
ncbi:formyltransferase family protein [Spirosoma sp. KNUC1025]|uniref:formyltransferase family protein n=1 Tax=Spirosoma sp. KNUC1025 TaxID=2894082 RepID=UPI003863A2F0|nr:hypothetical protein LN737_21510 [Spirosoma sp. KNUC1025]